MDRGFTTDLNRINRDLLFFFLLIVTSVAPFYIVLNKRRAALNQKNIGFENMNRIFQFGHQLQIIVSIYFVINAYDALERIKKEEPNNEEAYNTQLTVLVSNVFILIGAVLYLPIMNSDYVLTR